jgi:hypothetical protein
MIAKCPLLPPKATNRCAALSKPRDKLPRFVPTFATDSEKIRAVQHSVSVAVA